MGYEKRIAAFEENICKFPVDNNRITSDAWTKFRPQTLQHMQQCYPLVHGSVISLAHDFLQLKIKYGSVIEQKLYSELTMEQFFDRLATKRCVVFFQRYDQYLLRNGCDGNGKWENVGTENESKKNDKYDVSPEKKPKLSDYLSYDELVLSAMCGISSPTHFINDGDRRNCGKIDADNFGENKLYPSEGIYMGLVGARFEKSGFMEYSLMAVSSEQNKQENGYGNYIQDEKENDDDNKQELDAMNRADQSSKSGKSTNMIWRAFEKFYCKKYFPTYAEIKSKYDANDQKVRAAYYKKGGWGQNHPYLDRNMFRDRIRISIELFLFDADRRALEYKQARKTKSGAFCHIVGLGTGVWSFAKSEQDRIIVQVTKDIVRNTHLQNIDMIYFAWMHAECMMVSEDSVDRIFDGKKFVMDKSDKHKISVEFGRRSPADPLDGVYKNCLNVSMYAWDSNAFPGNEYYLGMLSASGDPAAASCSTISYVQNSEINKEYINGKNTGIYFYNPQKQEYEFYKMGDIEFEKDKEKWLKKSIDSLPFKRRLAVKKNNNQKL